MNKLNPIPREVDIKREFTDVDYSRLRSKWPRRISDYLYPIYRILSWVVMKSNDFWVIPLRESEPKLFLLRQRLCDDYRKVQTEANIRKINNTDEGNLRITVTQICKYIKKNGSNAKDGINAVCHGVRDGTEVKLFKENFESDDIVITGTDISTTATLFDDVIQWDYHDLKDEWENELDFI